MNSAAYLVFCNDIATLPVNVFDLYTDYVALMSRLHGPCFESNTDSFFDQLHAESESLTFIWKDKQLIACAQGSLARLHGRQHVYIIDVVVHDDYEGQGYGRILMSSLIFFAWKKWGQSDIPTRFLLSNSPRKANAGFYEKLGFHARTEANNDLTVVWVKDLQNA